MGSLNFRKPDFVTLGMTANADSTYFVKEQSRLYFIVRFNDTNFLN